MGVFLKLKMRLHIASLIFLLLIQQSWTMTGIRERIKYNLNIWVQAAAHCAESRYGDDPEHVQADQCIRCWATVGDWSNPDNSRRGQECLLKYEPDFPQMCQDKFKTYDEYPTIENRDAVDDCWEESYLRTIGKKCLESTKSLTKRSIGDQDLNLNMAGLCLLRHLSDNMKYAKKKVFGEEPEPFGGDFQHLIESVFEEARCEHANAGNIDRRQECNSCFNHVRNKIVKIDQRGWKLEDTKKISALWMFCSDNYLAPIYSDCFKNIDSYFKVLDDKPVNFESLQDKWTEMQGCQMLKQSDHFFEPCKDRWASDVDEIDGLMSYINCSQNLTMQWVTERRPEAAEKMFYFITMGGDPMPQWDLEDML